MNDVYLLNKLFTFGYAGITRDPKGDLRGLDCTRIGLDPYMWPTNLHFTNAILGSFDRTVNENAVFMPLNRDFSPIIGLLTKYARQLAEIDVTLDVNVINIRTTKIFPVSSDPEAQQIRRMVEDVENGLPATLKKNSLRDSIMNKNGVPAYSLAENYFVDKMIQDIRSKISEFLNILGVNTSGANQVKAERNLVRGSFKRPGDRGQPSVLDRAYAGSIRSLQRAFRSGLAYRYCRKGGERWKSSGRCTISSRSF